MSLTLDDRSNRRPPLLEITDSGTVVLDKPDAIDFNQNLTVIDNGDGSVTVDSTVSGTGTQISISNDNSLVVSGTSDINFNQNLSVTDDTDGTVTVDAGDFITEGVIAPDVLIVDDKSPGTDGGTANSGTRNTRDLNTILRNTISGASLASNQVTLPAGDYYVEASAPAKQVEMHKLFLENITDGVLELRGTNARSDDQDVTIDRSNLFGTLSFTSETTIEISQWFLRDETGNGLGVAVGDGTTERYTELKIWRS